MAELSISRNRKAAPKVDLTAMVDLAFLLITFFMLTTSLSKPIAMDVAKPDEGDPTIKTELPASRINEAECFTILNRSQFVTSSAFSLSDN